MHVTLQEVLDAREARVRTQEKMRHEQGAPVICFTMNIAGPIKTSAVIERAFLVGVRLIEKAISPLTVAQKQEEHTKCGPVCFWAVRGNADTLKSHMVEIEEKHPLGRLFDIDVIDEDGSKLSRQSERGCMVCGAPGRACAAGRLHSVAELTACTDKILGDFFTDADARRIAEIAKQSLLQEVYTAPKPGLVDPISRGSHTDMDVADFERSAAALEPYFADCVKAGAHGRGEPPKATFPRLRALGLEAERRMYAATGGVNTHKGAIFSLGILAGAVGRLLRPDGYIPSTKEILCEGACIARAAIEHDLERAEGSTAGGRAYLQHGLRGIRGEVADGFPSLTQIALPAYRRARASGKNKNDAGALTLLHLIASVYDTNLYKRGGMEGLLYAQERARALLLCGEPTAKDLLQLDADMIARDLSPGGCADLLALTYFLTDLEEERGRA